MATLLSNPGSLKRSGCDAVGVTFKKFKFYSDVDSDASLSGGAESIYSLQGKETATAHDTSDTEDNEYEVQSSSEVTISEPSSGPEECVVIGNFSSIVEEFGSDISYVADLSDSVSSDNEEFGYLSRKQCEKCKKYCEERFTLCLKCFRERKLYRPPRPKGRRRKLQSIRKTASSDLGYQGSPDGLEESYVDPEERRNNSQLDEGASTSLKASEGSSQDQRSSMCKCCFENPVDGAFIHKSTVHTLYCYKCSMKQWRMRGRCAFCNQKLCKVAKIYPVEDGPYKSRYGSKLSNKSVPAEVPTLL